MHCKNIFNVKEKVKNNTEEVVRNLPVTNMLIPLKKTFSGRREIRNHQTIQDQ